MNYNEACQWLDLDPSVILEESSVKTAFRRAAIREHPHFKLVNQTEWFIVWTRMRAKRKDR